jgi:hypothetical protein
LSRSPVMIQSLEPRVMLAAIDPYNMGKGDWIWYLSSARSNTGTSTNLALFQYLKNKGMNWVIVKASNGTDANFNSTQFNAQLVTDAHTAGLKLFAYQYVYGADPAGEAAAAKAVIARSTGIDGLIIDAETEYEHLANNDAAATTYLTTIKAAYPNLFLAHAPFPIVSYHSAFPYYTFGKYCDVVMPQDYFGAIKVTPQYMVTWQNDQWNTLYNGWKGTSKADGIKPLAPISQGWNDASTNTTTGADILTFINSLKTVANPASPGGYKGVSFWSVQHHTADMWNGIGTATIGNPVFSVGQTVQVVGTGTSGLKAWTDSSSAPPATYTVQPEGAVGTVISGPVFANGFNRWQIRWKGDNVNRWSAEDFLQAAPAPAAPTYTSPASGASFVNTPPASLNWNNSPLAMSYDVYLDGALKANVTGTTYSLSGLTTGSHTWQIRAKNSTATAAGATWSFTFTIPPPSMPSFPTPINVASVKMAPPVLDWADSSGATSYDVYYNGALQGNVTQSQWTPPTPAPPKVMQNWRVVAKNAGGSTPGPTWYFQVDPIPGDANVDGVVDTNDFAILMSHLNQTGTWTGGDFNGDGRIGFADFQVLELNFGQSVGVSADEVVSGVLAGGVSDDATPLFSLTPVRKPKPAAPVHRRDL